VTLIFFATDIHGSDICWNKFLNAGKFYEAELLILGGDMTGKAIVPIIDEGSGAYRVRLLEQEFELHSEEEVQEMVKRIKSRGYYPYRTDLDELAELNKTPEKVHDLFIAEALKTIEQWMAIAARKLKDGGARCYVCPGNDDMP
jgi:uncharacterized protein